MGPKNFPSDTWGLYKPILKKPYKMGFFPLGLVISYKSQASLYLARLGAINQPPGRGQSSETRAGQQKSATFGVLCSRGGWPDGMGVLKDVFKYMKI